MGWPDIFSIKKHPRKNEYGQVGLVQQSIDVAAWRDITFSLAFFSGNQLCLVLISINSSHDA